ncbi:uncharacterized protein N7459_007998 [Penicillium hispanicum]|uniref:uncharacterized protein n=1 Tax=Penicillium hispanicum TaxID=1080232 RepID=UPI0025405113|nr:uncharacterized protein N7459_007998 [Penicillium hispanicum]KAJ5573571.1 hypothetical protein N7459_007998 [Penicillium hispanicum]
MGKHRHTCRYQAEVPGKRIALTENAAIVLLLANEDNCLGIDFNKYASPLDQPPWSSDGTPHESFEERLRSTADEERTDVLDDPLSLIWDYMAGLSRSLSCHVELYRRKWKCLYEPHANTSAMYGDATSRAYVRKEARQLSTQIQYLQQSLSRLRQIRSQKLRKITSQPQLRTTRPQETGVNEIVRDFEQISQLLESLKSAYDLFIEQQVGKITLQETRQSMTEARDLQRLSYLGFVFAPLSLASSFFSINIRPLGGPASLRSFVVTSLSILFLSIVVLLSLNGRVYQVVLEASTRVRSLLSSLFQRYQEPSLPHTETTAEPTSFQEQNVAPGHVQSDGRGDMTGRTAPPQLSTRVNPSWRAFAQSVKSARSRSKDSGRSREETRREWFDPVSIPHRPPVREEYADPLNRSAISEVLSFAPAQMPVGQSIRQRGFFRHNKINEESRVGQDGFPAPAEGSIQYHG